MEPRSQPPLFLGTLLVVLAVAAVYHPVASFPFVWTDHTEIEQKILVPTSFQELGRAFTLAKGTAKAPPREAYRAKPSRSGYAYYRPVKAVTYALDWASGGGGPVSFHLTNLFLHAGCCLLLLLVCRRLAGNTLPWLAEVVALLHAVSPVHAESVAWISARSDMLWGLFMLAAILIQLRSRQAERWWPSALATLLMVLAAAGSKESGLVSAGVLLTVSVLVPDTRPFSSKRLIRECSAPLIAVLIYLAVRLLVIADVHLGSLGGRPGLGLWTTLHVFGLNLTQSFLPLGLTVSDAVEIHKGPSLLGLVGPLIWLAWLAAGFRLRRQSPVLLIGALGWLLSITPVMQIFPLLHPRGERYLYVPSMFAELSLVWTAWTLAARFWQGWMRGVLASAAAVALVSLLLYAHTRSLSWSDEHGLFAEAVTDSPDCAECWNNLAFAEAIRGRYPQASAACLRGLSVDRRRVRGARDGFSLRWILAKSLLLQGRGDEAVRWIVEIIRKRGLTRATVDMLSEALMQSLRNTRIAPTRLLWLPSGLHLDAVRRR